MQNPNWNIISTWGRIINKKLALSTTIQNGTLKYKELSTELLIYYFVYIDDIHW